MIDVASNQNKLVLAFTGPVGVVDRKALPCEMEDMTSFAFVEPENAFGSEHLRWQLIVQKVLEPSECEGPVTLERQRGETVDGEVI